MRRPDLERLVLLRQEADGYSYAGALLTYADALDLGASRIEQADLALSTSGAILLIVTPIQDGSPQNLGCVVFQVTDLGTATVLRDQGQHALPLANITGDPADSALGGGQCTYDASSATGVLMVLHDTTRQIVFSVHATGIHPDAVASVGGVAAPFTVGALPAGETGNAALFEVLASVVGLLAIGIAGAMMFGRKARRARIR